MHLISRALVALSALTLLGIGNTANAQFTFFPTNTTINYSVSNYVIIGYANQNDYVHQTNGTSPTVNLVSGGSISSFGYLVATQNYSVFNISGGSVLAELTPNDHSTVNVTGGRVDTYFQGQGNSIINVSGGSLALLEALQSSTINLSGGSIDGQVSASDTSTVDVSGGSVGGSFYASNSGALNFFGTGLSDTLTDPLNTGGYYSLYTLTGKLEDGTNITGKSLYIQNGSNATFTLNNVAATPEPSLYALLASLGLTGAAFLRRRICSLG